MVVDPELITDESRYKGPELIYKAGPAMTLRERAASLPRVVLESLGRSELGSSRHAFICIIKPRHLDVGVIAGRAGS